jgi:putative ABC transport system permease protein
MRIFDQTFLITYALLVISILVAVLGIVNTLSALILERRREIALLRILGVTRRELTSMVVLESSLIATTSAILGAVSGWVLAWILIFVINKQSFGWTIELHPPLRLVVLSLFVTFAATTLAGVIPARLAARLVAATEIKSE